VSEREGQNQWSALVDDFRTFLFSGSFQQNVYAGTFIEGEKCYKDRP
jgi:hypothetical protein